VAKYVLPCWRWASLDEDEDEDEDGDEDNSVNVPNWAEDLGPGAHRFPLGMLSAGSVRLKKTLCQSSPHYGSLLHRFCFNRGCCTPKGYCTLAAPYEKLGSVININCWRWEI
jgi:hypothetical protein